jgi:flagellar hook-length control protein FliK
MTPNVAMPTPSVPKPVAARGTAGHDAAHASVTEGQDRFGHQLDRAMKQPHGDAASMADTPPVALPKTALPPVETGQAPTGKDGDTSTDPAEHDGNALAAAVLALLGQGAAAPAHNAVTAKGEGLSLDAGKRGGQQAGASALLAVVNGADTSPAVAAAPSGGADASALISVATHAAAPETHKNDQAASIDALAAPLTTHANAPGATAPAHALKMEAPAGSTAFAQELGQQVAWLGGQEIKQARIRLHPEELGQLDVKVSVAEHGRVDVSFTAQHPAAVTAVQQTLGQLDQMLAGHGLSLGQAQVGQQGGQGSGREQGQATDEVQGHDIEGVAPQGQPIALGLLDTFA